MDRRAFLAVSGALFGSAACRRPDVRSDAATNAAAGGPSTAGSDAMAAASSSPGSASAAGSGPGPSTLDPGPNYPATAPKETIANGDLALHDWALPGDPKLARRAVVLVPTHLAKGERVPLLVALHGLAETANEELGAYAWVRKYGIGEGYAHLRAPSTITVEGLGAMATQTRVDELRESLAKTPFRGMVIACPYTPNHWKVGPSPEAVADAYASWLFDVLVPRLVAETPIEADPKHHGIDGVSLGGWSSLAVGVRETERLGAIGCVQAAISVADADRWSARIEKAFATHGARPLHLLTSTQDVFRKPVEALAAALAKRGVDHALRIAVGPHDQPFLRGPGSLEMLFWQARALG